MPGKIVSRAQQGYLAVHNKPLLHELSGGHIAKNLPEHVRPKGQLGSMHKRLYGKGK